MRSPFEAVNLSASRRESDGHTDGRHLDEAVSLETRAKDASSNARLESATVVRGTSSCVVPPMPVVYSLHNVLRGRLV